MPQRNDLIDIKSELPTKDVGQMENPNHRVHMNLPEDKAVIHNPVPGGVSLTRDHERWGGFLTDGHFWIFSVRSIKVFVFV